MIKIARDAAERLLLMTLYFKNREYNCLGILEESLGRKHPFKSNVVLRNLYNDGLSSGPGAPWTQWSEFCTHLQDQLCGGASTAHHPTLIDIIVDLLHGPYARNVISGRNLLQLRRAVLLPEEMIKFGESAKKEMGCAGCGKTFVHGEMTSFRHDGDGEGSAFYCTRCTFPTHAACRSGGSPCEGAGEVNNQILTKILQKSACDDHGTPKKEKSKEASVQEILEAERIRQELAHLANIAAGPDQHQAPDQAPQWVDVGQPVAVPPGGPFIGNDVNAQPAFVQEQVLAGAPDVPEVVPRGYRAVRLPGGRVEIRRHVQGGFLDGDDNPFMPRAGRGGGR